MVTLNPRGVRCTPFSMACEKGHLEIVRFLLSEGINIDQAAEDEHGDTPLYRACVHNRLEVVQFLVNKGADTNKASRDGKTPLHAA